MNDPCELANSAIREDGGSCEFLPYSTYCYNNKMSIKKNLIYSIALKKCLIVLRNCLHIKTIS